MAGGKRGATRGRGGEEERGRGGERKRGEEERGEAKAALFKQIRFGEIGLSLQDGDDLHPSITRGERRKQGLGYVP